MKNQLKLCLKTAWLTAAVAILVMGTNLCATTDVACFHAGETMFLLMLLLTFPGGILALVASMIVLGGESIHYPSDFITAWMVMAVGGIVQWFFLVPRFLAKPKSITLDLQAPLSANALASDECRPKVLIEMIGSSPAPVQPAVSELTATAQPEPPAISARRKRTKPIKIESISGFDRKGRSPLERVIHHL